MYLGFGQFDIGGTPGRRHKGNGPPACASQV
jgi:hypothetical protein